LHAEQVTNPLDTRHSLHQTQDFFPLRLVGHHAGEFDIALTDGNIDGVAPQQSALAELAGDGVGEGLIMVARGQTQPGRLTGQDCRAGQNAQPEQSRTGYSTNEHDASS